MRLPSFVTFTPRNSPTGKLTLRMICGSRSCSSAGRTSRAASSAQRSKEKCSPTSAEKAMDGMFSSAPSNAAEIVPEYVTSSPRFGPKLMPETTMSGRFSFISFSTARFTQSVGVPSTIHSFSSSCSSRSGRVSVSACDAAGCSRSGSTMMISPAGASTPARLRKPSEEIPSSLVRSMRGTRGIVAFHSDMTRSIVFAVIALVFGAAYALRTPAFEVPDEVAHYWRATAAAYGHLVVGERVGLPRGYRVIVWALTLTPDDNRVTSERLRKARGVLLQDEFRDKTPVAGLYSPATYVPQIVAAAVSRAASARPYFSFFVGRLATLVFAVIALALTFRPAAAFRPALEGAGPVRV